MHNFATRGTEAQAGRKECRPHDRCDTTSIQAELSLYFLRAALPTTSCFSGCRVRDGVSTANIPVVPRPDATWNWYIWRTSARSRRRSQPKISSRKEASASGEGGVYAAHAATNWEKTDAALASPLQAERFVGSGK